MSTLDKISITYLHMQKINAFIILGKTSYNRYHFYWFYIDSGAQSEIKYRYGRLLFAGGGVSFEMIFYIGRYMGFYSRGLIFSILQYKKVRSLVVCL